MTTAAQTERSREFTVVAIVAAYNEGDIIGQCVAALIDEGVQVCVLDDSSTDNTVAEVEPYLGRGVLKIERLTVQQQPSTAEFQWERILQRKEELAQELDADWFIHNDADEFRESPWPHVSLYEAIRRVDALGFNAIDSARFDFWPIDDSFRSGDDVRRAFRFYTEPAAYDQLQIRCWKKRDGPVHLASSGGHEVRFADRRVFPVRFILRHYPIRGQAHGERKVFHERRPRFIDAERSKGWHVQYDGVKEGTSFIREPAALKPYDPDAVRLALTLRHRGVEELEEALAKSLAESALLRRAVETVPDARAHDDVSIDALRADIVSLREQGAAASADVNRLRLALSDASADATRLRRELDERTGQLTSLRETLASQDTEIACLRASLADDSRRLDAVYRSLSWRWTAPVRMVCRLIFGQR
jgi:hypothetical protein